MIKRLLGYGFESNVYLIMDEKIALIDAGTGFETKNLIKEIEEYADKIDIIILTHEHLDHCGGAAKLKKHFNAKVAMHERGSIAVEEGIFSEFFNARIERTRVDIKLKGGEIIKLGEYELHVIRTPGHSMGSICLYEPNKKALFSGDTIFLYGGIGRTDFPGGNATLFKKSIEKLSKLDVKALYPGHGDYDEKNGDMHIKLAMQSINLL
ncbi:MAG: MBL fold metallo-hydrolase [Thermoplasmata archaeon]|nr:MBL fold metallo-hydrolase [Thermoplasmata archaeon]